MKLPEMNKEELQEVINKCVSYSEVYRVLGYKKINNHNTLKTKIKEFNLDISNFTHKGENSNKTKLIPNEFVFIKTKESQYNNGIFRRRILTDNLIKYTCSLCGNNGTWNDKELVLQLDHIDGDRCNNELNNLRFLCPNCHTQTETYSNKKRETNTEENQKRLDKLKANKKIFLCKECTKELYEETSSGLCRDCYIKSLQKERPNKELLKTLIRTESFISLGKKFNVSDNTIRRWCSDCGLPKLKSQINKFSDLEWEKI